MQIRKYVTDETDLWYSRTSAIDLHVTDYPQIWFPCTLDRLNTIYCCDEARSKTSDLRLMTTKISAL